MLGLKLNIWLFTLAEISFGILFPGILLLLLSDSSLIVREPSDLDKIVCIVVRPRVDKNIFWHTVIFLPGSFSMWNTLVYLFFRFVFFFFDRIGVITSTVCEIHCPCLNSSSNHEFLAFFRLWDFHDISSYIFFWTRSNWFTRTKHWMFL